MNDRYDDGENKNRNNFFLNSDELSKIAKTLKNSFGNSVREIMDMINNAEVPQRAIVPAKNKRIVEQNPREIKNSASMVKLLNVATFLSIAVGIIVIFQGFIDFLDITTIFVGLMFLVAGFFTRREMRKQKLISKVMQRYNKYLRGFGSGAICNIRELALLANVDEETVLNDISYYIQKDYFKEARIVDGAVMLDNKTYEEYRRIPIRSVKQEEKIEEPKAIERNYLGEMLNYHESLEEPMKSEVKELLLLVEKIYSNAKAKPQDLEQFERFREYYLPSVLKLLGEYELIQKSGLDSPKILELKEDIKSSIKIINEAFRNLLEDMYEGAVIDIKTDISVLKSMLHQEGLLDRL